MFIARDSVVHQLHPLTKLTLAGGLLIAGLVLPGLWANYILVLVVLFPLTLLGGIFHQWLRMAGRVVLPFAVSMFLIQGFLWTGGTPILSLWVFSLKLEGLYFAIASTGRVMIVVGGFIWFALTTRPDILMIALVQRGFPAKVSYIIVATIQIIPRFQARATAILDAQRARGLETRGNLLQRGRAVIPLVVPLILSSLVDVEERALAVETRAFDRPGRKTSLVEIKEAAWEKPLRWLILLSIGGALVWRFWSILR